MEKEQFIKEAKKVWNNNEFDYSHVKGSEMKLQTKRVTLECNRCSLIFRRNYLEHLNKVGCPICDKKEVIIHI